MSEFISALAAFPFLQNALATCVLASVAGGVVGGFVVARRITYMAGAIAHCVLGGMGAARYLQVAHGQSWSSPLLGAMAAACIAAVVIGWVSLKARQREDTIIGAVWALGMAGGVLFIAATPGYAVDLMGYLFGDILMVTKDDLWMVAGLDLVVVVVMGWLLYHPMLAICFDEQFARTRGLPVDLYFIILLMLTAITVVILTTVVGLVMVIALLTLPVGIADRFAKSLRQIMALAAGISVATTVAGLAVSYAPNLPAGAVIILLNGLLYLAVTGWFALSRRRSRP